MPRSEIIKKSVSVLCGGMLIFLIAGNFIFPHIFQRVMPYRFYHVLTSSMEPLIPAHSFVCVRKYNENQELRRNDIITFNANRFGEKIIITHRFSHTEINRDGEVIYRTHPEESNILDVYETTAGDILGVYVFHIPYAGKFILFLKSRFGLLWICEVITIVLLKEYIAARWQEAGNSIKE